MVDDGEEAGDVGLGRGDAVELGPAELVAAADVAEADTKKPPEKAATVRNLVEGRRFELPTS